MSMFVRNVAESQPSHTTAVAIVKQVSRSVASSMDRRAEAGPTGIKREMRDCFYQFLRSDAVLYSSTEVKIEAAPDDSTQQVQPSLIRLRSRLHSSTV